MDVVGAVGIGVMVPLCIAVVRVADVGVSVVGVIVYVACRCWC